MRLLIYMPSYGDGGVERMLVNLAGGLCQLGVTIDFWVKPAGGPFLERLPAAVRQLAPVARGPLGQLRALSRYLRAQRPEFVLTAKDPALGTAVRAVRLARVPTRVIARPGTTVSERLAGRNVVRRWLALRTLRRRLRRADLIVANSQGVARDVARVAGLAGDRVAVVRNPVITPDLARLAAAPPPHPWIGEAGAPIVLGAGGLRRAKDFPTLVRAFAQVRAQRRCRLIILGRGRLRGEIVDLAARLGLAADVALPGFVENPYPYLKAASVFVLSSRWEGSPNVLTEAMALGTPVVATDCPSGPREVLAGGRYGPLVPVGEPEPMAEAILQVLNEPPAPEALRSAVSEYTVERCAARYLELMQAALAR